MCPEPQSVFSWYGRSFKFFFTENIHFDVRLRVAVRSRPDGATVRHSYDSFARGQFHIVLALETRLFNGYLNMVMVCSAWPTPLPDVDRYSFLSWQGTTPWATQTMSDFLNELRFGVTPCQSALLVKRSNRTRQKLSHL